MLESDSSALVIIDVQGRLAEIVHQHDLMLSNVKIMIQSAKILEIPILWLEQVPNKLGGTRPEILPFLEGCAPIPKVTFSAWQNDAFRRAFRALNRRQVLVAGIETHICVYQTTRDLLQAGMEVHVLSDAVSSRVLENKLVGLTKMKALGADITSVETAVFELMKAAEGPKFKEIIRFFM